MCQTVVGEALYHRVAGYYLTIILCCRVAVVCRLHIACQQSPQLRESAHYAVSDCHGILTCGRDIITTIRKTQSGKNLISKQFMETLHPYADMIRDGIHID